MSTPTQSPTFGNAGTPSFNDLTSAGPNITRISKIIVNYGEVLDGLTITYETASGPKTETHGGRTGNEVTVTLSADENIVGVCGNYGFQSSVYGTTSINQLQFIIVNKSTGIARIAGPFAPTRTSTAFRVIGEVVAFAGSLNSNGRFIQALSCYTK
ncbi:hypothetical protein QCA50_004049 [Cerrena zonata]|uniref:Jacalin-type lectin domain-containing protein n=1 Tax=Cerrena zonata TaxID=2478898 RepID=A0AAW0GSB1_9APHY